MLYTLQTCIGVASYGALGYACPLPAAPRLPTIYFVLLLIWSYTEYDGNLLCEISSVFAYHSYKK